MNCKPDAEFSIQKYIFKKKKKLPKENLDSIFHTTNTEIIKQEMSNEDSTSTEEQINYQLTV